ncbi:MAG: SDR family oxidoreductase [Phycisphaerae bacterium]|nr:SDR family oxidoreductase [Phycisphaerae bacterium]
MNLKNKTALITGSTGRLARAIVLSLAQAGSNCICLYNKNSAQAKKLEREIKDISEDVIARTPKADEAISSKKRDCFASLAVTNCVFIQTDLTNEKNIEKTFAEIEKFATPQILINAAAVFDKKPLEKITSDYIRQTFDTNFTAPMLITQKFVSLVRRKFKTRQKPLAKIINLTDIVAESPPAGFSIYSASKAALICMTKSLAKELAPDFTVNAVSPGVINFQKGASAELKKKILSHIPAARTGSPAEVASAVKFLIENDYITGQIINIDGGKAG